MKRLLFVLFVMVCGGTCFGIAISGVESKPFVRNGQEEAAKRRMDEIKAAVAARNSKSAEQPLAMCEQPSHNFGLMDPLTVGSHTFTVFNDGTSPLLLKSGGSSCKCTLSDLDNATVSPGASHDITLTWNSGHAKRSFGQTATILTNDPLNQEIRLTISGEVRAVLASLDETVDLGRLTPSTPKSRQFVVYSQIWDELEIDRIESTSEHVRAEVDDQPYQGSFSVDDEINSATASRVIKVTYDGEAPHGALSGMLRVHVRPPKDWSQQQKTLASERLEELERLRDEGRDGTVERTAEAPKYAFPVEADGSVVADIGFHGQVVRRLSLYGKCITARPSIDLGNLHTGASKDTTWNIIGRVRGDQRASEITATISGIPGLAVQVTQLGSKDSDEQSFRLTLTQTTKLRPAIYDRGQAGKLVVKAPGIPGNEQLEFPVELVVLENR